MGPSIGFWPALLFTLYYIAVTSFWLSHIINGLVSKAVMRVVMDPSHNWRHGIVVHFWQIIYIAFAILGLFVLSAAVGSWVWWLDGLYALVWLLMLGGSIIRLASPSAYANAATRKEFLDLIPPEGPPG